MTDSTRAFKSFDQLDPAGRGAAGLLDRLLAGKAAPGPFGGQDLREMAKEREIPNVHGLAAYPIERPTPHLGGETGALAPRAELPAGVVGPLANMIAATPLVRATGLLASAGGASLRVEAIVSQWHAHLAAALAEMLHPWPAGPDEAADYRLLVWPDPVAGRRGRRVLDQLIGHWPDPQSGGVGLAIGCDDPAVLAAMLEDAWRRRRPDVEPPWRSRLQPVAKLAATADGRDRALAMGTLLYGVECDSEGRFPMLDCGMRNAEISDFGFAISEAGWALVNVVCEMRNSE